MDQGSTEKSKLLNKLKEVQDGFTETPLPLIDVTLIDGGLLIHSFLSAIWKITLYENIAGILLAYVCGSGGAMRFTYCLILIIPCP